MYRVESWTECLCVEACGKWDSWQGRHPSVVTGDLLPSFSVLIHTLHMNSSLTMTINFIIYLQTHDHIMHHAVFISRIPACICVDRAKRGWAVSITLSGRDYFARTQVISFLNRAPQKSSKYSENWLKCCKPAPSYLELLHKLCPFQPRHSPSHQRQNFLSFQRIFVYSSFASDSRGLLWLACR